MGTYCRSHIYLSKESPSSEIAELPIEKQLWLDYFDPNKPELTRFRERLIFNGLEGKDTDVSEIADSFVSNYIEYCSKKHLDTESIKNNKLSLIKIVQGNLTFQFQVHSVEGQSYYAEEVLGDGNFLRVFKTRGDGSCGLHAINGTLIDGEYRDVEIEQTRKNYSNFLREKQATNHLPEEIREVLVDYFISFQHAPSGFQERTKKLHTELNSQYQKPEEGISLIDWQEKIKEQFLSDESVIEAYLSHIEKVGSYLLQSELVSIANWLEVSIRLCQPDWGKDDVLAHSILNPGHPETITVLFRVNHYERAEFIPAK